ncbi:MAG: hypothetical protein A2Y25_08845 [Candidatus Melainabacteria bacterium GWF2_37_15]|nr:MAG: hypothetical protein A2Y25_08845 [Candidatus Melainabacteria bacterium GWF2_37_15]
MKNENLGIDIGGTKIFFACVDQEKVVSDVISYATPDTAQGILNCVCEGIEKFHHIKAIGIATAGTVDLKNSQVTGSTGNLPQGYSDLNFGKVLKEKFNVPVFVENDANAAAYAEYKAGSARGHNNTITITLGTGVGGGIIVDGKLLRGTTGAAAEVGHIPITWEKRRKCTCGLWDCWEAYASGTAYHKYKDSYDVWEEYVSMGLSALINVFEPESIILSGGMAKLVNYETLRNRVKQRVLIADTQILPAKFENYAGLLGAALLAENL